ncbi:MAG: (Fe-S)-binding protein [Bacteroidetes bacterium]|jgi:L-lactate dehydrogenase complex protein LldE|nr:(Fe-S)-binding protein [Bacteroidota bacterium]MBT3748222.1 (Fe-S)-binding protein [Bacteroidota bacterium]MBT4399527.1 (Fe-S)-binding protein [Bacteroidota bacterium]MBT4409329.1 (Fe-S)-binding protein [Bacteroidota bacterium]MBT5426020.1 (Fe-S)-binding protein [Bacteroidota bacterium]
MAKKEIDLFIPCFIDQLYPDTGENVIRILEKLGITVHYNPEQTCCGQPAFNGGHWDPARDLAKKFLNDFPGNRMVVSPSASCTGFVKNYYPDLLENTIYMNNYRKLKPQLIELTDFLVNHMGVTDLGARFDAKVTYHDACSALREYGLKDEPRILLSKVKGLELIEMEGSDVCCGFGGTFSVKHEAISTAMAQQKVNHAHETGAEYIVTTEASCMMHMDAYIKQHDIPIKCIHIADILVNFDQGRLIF